jgi:biotin carboxyl carrier protein
MHLHFPDMAVSYHAEAEFLQKKNEQSVIVEHFSAMFGDDVFTFEPILGYPALFKVHSANTDEVRTVIAMHHEHGMEISLNGYSYFIEVQDSEHYAFRNITSSGTGKQNTVLKVPAPMPGFLKSISVQVGQSVKKGDALFVLEAMKMENIIKSPIAGTLLSIPTESGKAIEKGSILCTIGRANKD